MPRVALITGAGRGIGLELCRQLSGTGWVVVACPRSSGSAELIQLQVTQPDRFHVVGMDVAVEDSVARAAAEVECRVDHLDLLINNAGINPDEGGPLPLLDLDTLGTAFEANAVGALRVARAFLPLLRHGEGKRLIQVTSLMGSSGENTTGGSYAYRMSKAALNMATRNLALELGPRGFLVLALHPGWVQTRMGGPAAPLGVREATEELLRLALGTGHDQNGAFLGPGGKRLPY